MDVDRKLGGGGSGRRGKRNHNQDIWCQNKKKTIFNKKEKSVKLLSKPERNCTPMYLTSVCVCTLPIGALPHTLLKRKTPQRTRAHSHPYPHPRTLPRVQAGENPSHFSLQTAVQTSKTVQQLHLASETCWFRDLSEKGKPAAPVLFSEACLLQTSSASKGSQLAPKALVSLQTVTPTTDLFAGTPKPAENTEL